MPVLRILKGPISESEFSIDQEQVQIGRDPRCQICLARDSVSRIHAELLRTSNGYFLVDRTSRNGTFVNSERLIPGAAYPLRDRDLIRICDFYFSYRDESGDLFLPTDVNALTMFDTAADDEPTPISVQVDASSDSWSSRIGQEPAAKLKAVMEITRTLYAGLSLDELISNILEILLKTFAKTDRALIVLVDSKGGPLGHRLVRCRSREDDHVAAVSRTIIDHVMKKQKAIVSDDIRSDFETTQSIAESPMKSIMCAPILDPQGKSIGAIQLDTVRHRQHFGAEELELLATVAMQISFAIEAHGRQAEQVQRAVQQHEMELAREIQMSLLPSTAPSLPSYEFYDHYSPAREVGGDYYDYVELADGRLAVIVGDVSGKGVPAALVMVNLSSGMQTYLRMGMEPEEAVAHLNRTLARTLPPGRFVTLALLVLDPGRLDVDVINAGHWPPLVRRASGEVVDVGAGRSGLPIGIRDDTDYARCQTEFRPGDTLLLLTDGILDAENGSRNTYRIERVRSQLAQTHGTARDVGGGLIDDVLRFAGECPQADDMCLVCVQRREAGP